MSAVASEPLPTAAWHSTSEAGALEFSGSLLTALESGDADQVRRQLVQALANRFGGRIVLGWRHGGRWQTAVTGMPAASRTSDLGRALIAALAETCLQSDMLRWPASGDSHSPVPPTYRQLANLAGTRAVAGLPLRTQSGTAAALLILGDSESMSGRDEALLWELAAPLAGLVQILGDASPSAWRCWSRRLAALVQGRRRRWLVLGAAAIVTAMGLIPVSDRISCPATLEPQLRRFVVAPQNGILQRALVKVGDPVAAGQSLAALDRRPLEIELSLLQAQSDEVARRRDAARAKGQAAQAQLAELELAQAASKIKHLQHQLAQLTVASPIAGVVVRGDLQRVEGAALARGQSLFEIAPLAPLVAELAIPEDEVHLVEAGMPVTLWPAALPGQSLAGTIARVHPQAEVRENHAVFIAEVVVPNDAGALRPGMRAQAVVWSASQPLAWTAIRRPALRLSRWMWW